MTAEAVAGSWDGACPKTAKVIPPTDELQYLSSERRRIVLFAELARHVSVVKKGSDSAQLTLDNQVLTEIQRPDNEYLVGQLNWLRAYSDLRMDRIPEINQQISDLLSFFGASALMNADGRKATMELLTLTQDFAIMLEMSAKHFCWTPRPSTLQPKVMPIIQPPDHSAFPSGHAMEAFAMATVLDRLISGSASTSGTATPGLAQKAVHFQIAQRIATNRTIAGVHYPVDSAAGAVMGVALGDALWALATPRGTRPPQPRPFRPGKSAGWFKNPASCDFLLEGLKCFYENPVPPGDNPTPVTPNSLWKKHWERASAEWVEFKW
jgi:hypothetical protein